MARRSRICPPQQPQQFEQEESKPFSLSQIDANGMAAKYDEHGRFIGYVWHGLGK
jgi:hypothetical protein